MYEKSLAVVLHTIPYSDSAVIVHLYTRRFGRVGYLLRTGTGRRARQRRALLSPFTLLEIEADHKPGRSLQQIGEMIPAIPLHGIQSDPVKCAEALFLSELFSRVVQECEPNHALFDFLSRSIQLLDRIEQGKENFHLAFLIQLTLFLGCYPNLEGYRDGRQFDMQSGLFVDIPPPHAYLLSQEESRFFALFMRMDYRNMSQYRFNREIRNRILDEALVYLRLHLPGIAEIKSLDVLRELFA